MPIRTRFLESFQLFTLQFLDGGHDGFERSFQPLPKHHVVRLGPKPDAVFILICGEGELAHVQLLQTDKAPIRSAIQCINIQPVEARVRRQYGFVDAVLRHSALCQGLSLIDHYRTLGEINAMTDFADTVK